MTSAQTESKQKYFNFEYLGKIELVWKNSHVLCTWDHEDWLFLQKLEKYLMLVYL
jgi:hypothetical protein